MNQKPLFLTIALLALLVIGGAFCFMSKRSVVLNQLVVTDPIVETPVQTRQENSVNTSDDWKMYTSKELGFEFKYPSNMTSVLDTEPGSTWGTEDEIMEEVSLVKNEKSVLWVLHTSKESLIKNRKKLEELSDLSQKKGQGKIFQDESELSINGVKVTKINYCSYSLAGVNCDFIMPTYYFPMRDGTYIMMRADSWWSTEEDRGSLVDIANSFRFISVGK